MPTGKPNQKSFAGFPRPEKNFFQMPNSWTDITAEMKSLAEVKVVEYVLRHTWGYQEYGIAKRITTDEFMEGRKRNDGSRMDRGTGLSNRSVIDGLRRAVTGGYLIEEVDASDKARIKKAYRLKMADWKDLPPDVKNVHIGVKNVDSGGKESSQRSEKDTLEKHFKKTVANGGGSPVMQLPKIDQPDEKAALIAQDVLNRLGDSHSLSFYRQVAARVPESVVRQTLAEIATDGADEPPKAFTFRMNQFALERLKKRIGE